MDSPLGCFCLATELIVMIFKEIHNVHDAIMLGLTHDTLMLIGWKHIRSLILQDGAPWAGCRIICVGEYTETLPDRFLSDEEAEELRRLDCGLSSDEPINLSNISRDHFDHFEYHFHMPSKRLWALSSKEYRILSQIIKETRYEWENGWVLMNLSTMEYVTSKAASRILRFMNPTDGRCFGQLILSRICWSSDGSTAIYFDRPLHQGVWAGDRFRIVTTDVFKARTSDGEGWADVSVEAAKWLRDILRSDSRHGCYPCADVRSSDEESENEKGNDRV